MLKKAPFLVATLVLTALVAAGCRNPTAPATEVPPNWVQMSDNPSGITIAVPSEWVQIPMPKNSNVADFNQTAVPLATENLKLLRAVNQARQVLQFGGKLFAVTTDGQTRVNITVDKTKEKTLEQLAANVVPQLEDSGARDLTQEQVTTGAGPALKLRFKFPIDGEGNETVLADEWQYYVLHNGKSYVLTVINPTGALADQIAGTLRLR
ncbi:MAG: hypothetical protein ACRD12_17960 [Acidimicrobiales bacterium]